MVKSKRAESQYIDLSDKPVGKDGLPLGTKCTDSCLKPPMNSNWAHCPTCHSSFRALGFFDSHRQGGRCLKPSAIGLTEVEGLWATPEGHEQRTMLADRLNKARKSRAAKKTP